MRGLRTAVTTGLVALVFVGCSDDGGATTGPTEAVIFGEGELPQSVPEDFPLPPGAVIGTTLVDKINNRTEFRLTVSADMETTVRFFQVGLVNQGYVISRSEGNPQEWTMEFADGELGGSIFATAGGQFSSCVVTINTS